MSKPKQPVPLPRRQRPLPDKPEVNPQLAPTQPAEGGLCRSTPPPVSPKKWVVKNDTGHGRLEIVKVMAELSGKNYCAQPPPTPAKPPQETSDDEDENEKLDTKSLLEWWKKPMPWKLLCRDHKLRGEREAKIVRVKAQHLYKSVRLYMVLLSLHGDSLREYITELHCIADNLDKVSKGTKIAGITGGASTVLGGVAAAAGVILSPFTMGASLGLTAVGVGVAAAGGVTGASAAIAHKVNVTQDKSKFQKILNVYKELVTAIRECVIFIDEGMWQLNTHDLSILDGSRKGWERVVRQLAAGWLSARTGITVNDKESRLIQGFSLGMEMFYSQGKNGEKLKKGLESKFAQKIRTLAEELSDGLDELMQIKNFFSEHCLEE